MSDAYGELEHQNDPVGTVLALPNAGVFVKWTPFGAGLAGPTDLVQVDAVNDQFVIGANGAGRYDAKVACSFTASPNILVHSAVFLNGVQQMKLEVNAGFGAATGEVSSSISGLIDLVADDILDLRFSADLNAKQVNVIHLTFILHAVTRAL